MNKSKNQENISLKILLRESLNKYEEYKYKIIKLLALLLFYDVASFFIEDFIINQNNNIFQLFLSLIQILISSYIDLAVLVFFLQIIFKKKIHITINKYLYYIWVVFLVSVGFILGLIVFIVPAVYFIIRSYFSDIITVEKNISPKNAIKESFNLTKNNKLIVFKLSLIIFVFYLPSIIFTLLYHSTDLYTNFVTNLASSIYTIAILPIAQISVILLYKKIR